MLWLPWVSNKRQERPAAESTAVVEPLDDAMLERRTKMILAVLHWRDAKYSDVDFYVELKKQVEKVRLPLFKKGMGVDDKTVSCFVKEWVREWVSTLSEEQYTAIVNNEQSGHIYDNMTIDFKLTEQNRLGKILDRTRKTGEEMMQGGRS